MGGEKRKNGKEKKINHHLMTTIMTTRVHQEEALLKMLHLRLQLGVLKDRRMCHVSLRWHKQPPHADA
jgi:hypothetical protein